MNASPKTIALTALGTGVAGWIGSRTLWNNPGSTIGIPDYVPFVPMYAGGGAIIATMMPYIQNYNFFIRALFYAGAITAFEGAMGYLDRASGRKSWDYNGKYVDLPHSFAWGILGLVTEGVIKKVQNP